MSAKTLQGCLAALSPCCKLLECTQMELQTSSQASFVAIDTSEMHQGLRQRDCEGDLQRYTPTPIVNHVQGKEVGRRLRYKPHHQKKGRLIT